MGRTLISHLSIPEPTTKVTTIATTIIVVESPPMLAENEVFEKRTVTSVAPRDACLKTCTVMREADGKWFASLVFEEVVPIQNIDATQMGLRTPVGVDLGLLSLITTSDGEKVEHPRFLRKARSA